MVKRAWLRAMWLSACASSNLVPRIFSKKMKRKITNKNLQLQKLIGELKKASIDQKAAIWKRLAQELERPSRNKRVVNLSKINFYGSEGEVVVVPGKVLGTGDLDKKITIAAYNFSEQAIDKIKKANSSSMDLIELVKKNPKGKGVKILG